MNYEKTWLRNEEGGDAGMNEGGQSGGGAGENQQQQQQSNGQFDYSKLAGAIGESIRASLPRQEQQAKMSDEDFRKLTHYYGVSEQDVTDLFGQPPEGADVKQWYAQKAGALQRMLDGSNKHTLAVTGLKSRYDLDALNRQFEPIVAEINQRKFDGYVKGIVSGNETLKAMGDNGKKLVETAIGMLQSQGFKATPGVDEKQVIIQTVQKIVETAGGQFQSQQQQSGAGRAAGMAGGVNSGGGSGAGSGANKGGKQPWEKLPF